MTAQTEHELQTAIIALIRKRGGVATRVNSGNIVNSIRGASKGTADIIACYRGRYLAIEVKSSKGKPTIEQLVFGDNVRMAGGVFFVTWNLETVNNMLDALSTGKSIGG